MTSLSTTNYQMPYTIGLAFPDYVGAQPNYPTSYGTVRVTIGVVFRGKSA
jgi:hypothetical protein